MGCEERPLRKSLQEHEEDNQLHLRVTTETVLRLRKELSASGTWVGLELSPVLGEVEGLVAPVPGSAALVLIEVLGVLFLMGVLGGVGESMRGRWLVGDSVAPLEVEGGGCEQCQLGWIVVHCNWLVGRYIFSEEFSVSKCLSP